MARRFPVNDLKPHEGDPGRAQSADDQQTHRWCIYHLDRALASRRSMEIDWNLTILYRLGYQHVVWSDNLRTFVQSDASPPYRARIVDNEMKPLMAERVARFIRQRGEPNVMPSSTDPSDRARAKSDTTWLRYLFRSSEGEAVFSEMCNDLVDTGNGCIKTFWDRSAGPRELEPERDPDTRRVKVAPGTECSLCGGSGRTPAPMGQGLGGMPGMSMQPGMGMPMGPPAGGMPAPNPMMQGGAPMMGGPQRQLGNVVPMRPQMPMMGAPPKMEDCPLCHGIGGDPVGTVQAQGDPRFRAVHPLNVLFNPGAQSTETAEHAFERSLLTTQECRRRWEKRRWLFADSNHSTGYDFTSLRASSEPNGLLSGALDHVGMQEVWTMHTAPSDDHPDGYVYRFTRKGMVEDFDNPDPEMGWNPFTWFIDERVPNSMYGKAPAAGVRPMQDQLNATWGQIYELGDEAASRLLLIGADVVYNQQQSRGYPFNGRVLELAPFTTPSSRPAYLDPPPTSPELWKRPEQIIARMRELMLAGVDDNDTQASGRKVALQDARADKLNTSQFVNQHRGLRRIYQRLLWLAKRYTQKTRKLVILGRGNSVSQIVFEPSTTAFDPADVYVTTGRVFSDSPVANAEIFLEMGLADYLVKKDGVTPDRRRILEAVGYGWDDFENDDAISEEMALEECRVMEESGQALPISPTDDHQIHGDVTVARARTYPVGHPLRTVLDQHAQEHIFAYAQNQMMQQQAQGANTRAGAPPAGGISIPGQQMPTPAAQSQGPGGVIQAADNQLEQMAAGAASGQAA